MAAAAAGDVLLPSGSAQRGLTPPGSIASLSKLRSENTTESTPPQYDFRSLPHQYTDSRLLSAGLTRQSPQTAPGIPHRGGSLSSPFRPVRTPVSIPAIFGPGSDQRAAQNDSARQSKRSEEVVATAMPVVPEATPDNAYLGFCKAAWNLQNGDKKASFGKARESGAYSRSGSNNKTTTPYYLQCKEPKCTFRSNFISSDVEVLWSRVFVYPERGIKLRWSFLAKSHVPQRVAPNAQYSFKCLFCVYMGRPDEVHGGMLNYLDHISAEHRGKDLGQVVEYKTRCVNNRIANDQENYDINLWPSTARGDVVSEWLDDPMDPRLRQRQGTIDSAKSMSASPGGAARGSHDQDAFDDSESIAARAEQLFRPSQQFAYNDPMSDPLASLQNRSNPWDDFERNPWAADAMLRPQPSKPSAIEESVDPHVSNETSQAQLTQSPVSVPVEAPAPQLPPRSVFRPSEPSPDMQQMQQHLEQSHLSSGDAEDALTDCLNEIVLVFREAADLLEDMKQEARRSLRAPPDLMLEEALSDAPIEIEKQRSRGLARYSDMFEHADPQTVGALQRIERHLHSNLLRPLKKMASNHGTTTGDFRQLTREAESGQLKTTTILFEWRERLEHRASSSFGSLPSTSPHTLQPPQIVRSQHSSRTPSYEIARHCHFSDDSHSAADSERQASTASTSSGSHQHQVQATAADSRRRSSVLTSFFKHGRKSGSDASQTPQPDAGKSGMNKLDFRQRKQEGPYPPNARAVELDSRPILPNR